MKKLKIITLIGAMLFSTINADAIYMKVVSRTTHDGGPNGYSDVTEERGTFFIYYPFFLAVRTVSITCENPGWEPCPASIVSQNNDLTPFEAYCYNFMTSYGLTQLEEDNSNGIYTTTINQGGNSEQYKVEWTTDENGEETVDVYRWFPEE